DWSSDVCSSDLIERALKRVVRFLSFSILSNELLNQITPLPRGLRPRVHCLRHRRSHNLRRPPQTPATGSPFHPQRQSASHPAPLPTSSLPSWSASAHTLPDQSAPAEPQPTPCSSSSQPPAVPLGRFADRTCSATWPAASSAPQETQAAVSLLPSAAALPQPASAFCL